MAHAHCMLYTLVTHKKARTHTQYVCLLLFPLRQWLYERASVWRHSYITYRVDTGFCWGNLQERECPEDKTTIIDHKQHGNRTCDPWRRTGTNDRHHKRSEILHWLTLFKDSVPCTLSYRDDILEQSRYPWTNVNVLIFRRRQGFNDWSPATGKQKPQNSWHNQIQRPGLTGSKKKGRWLPNRYTRWQHTVPFGGRQWCLI